MAIARDQINIINELPDNEAIAREGSEASSMNRFSQNQQNPPGTAPPILALPLENALVPDVLVPDLPARPPEESPPTPQVNFSISQPIVSALPAPGTVKTVLDWTAFWVEANIPGIGYDSIDDKLVVLKGADHSADSSKDILVYDFRTGTWTRGDTKIAGSDDMTNMMTAPDTGELVIMHQNNSAGSHIKRFKAHQSASISSSTVNIVTPFFDFGSSGQKKRLYKVLVLCTGTNLDDLDIVASYDGDTDTYADIFSSNTFANNADAADWDTQTFTVATPTDFTNISIKIYSTGAMTTANWGISEIAFVYREKGIR